MVRETRFPMTQAGRDKLVEELAYLTVDKRKNVVDRIKKARSFCDFAVDSEFEEALKEQTSVEERIRLLKDMIHHAEIIKIDDDEQIVSIGKTVTIIEQPAGDEETYTIVGLAEADPFKNKISDQSPLAQSLLGKKLDDEVLVTIPGGQMKIIISAIK